MYSIKTSKVNLEDIKKLNKKDRYSSIISSFVQILLGNSSSTEVKNLTRQDFMNISMLVYSNKKHDIENLVSKYERMKAKDYQAYKNSNNVRL